MLRAYAWCFRITCLVLGVGLIGVMVHEFRIGGRLLLGGEGLPTVLRIGVVGCTVAFLGVGLGVWPSSPGNRVGPDDL